MRRRTHYVAAATRGFACYLRERVAQTLGGKTPRKTTDLAMVNCPECWEAVAQMLNDRREK